MQETAFQPTWFDGLLKKVFGGFAKWDAVYFLEIADEGYKYEQFMAFFPLYPWTLRALAWIFQPGSKFMIINEQSSLLVIGWTVNTVCFILAAIALYKLTLRLFGRCKVALLSSLLFCFNPASIFMSSLYTESMFAFLQFTGMYFLEREISTLAVLLFSLGCATRSNGILSCGFISHYFMKKILSSILISQKASNVVTVANLVSVVVTVLILLFLNGIVLAPFIIFQWYGYKLYCLNTSQQKLPWCNKWLPFPYSHIQSAYWDVGFLRYFEMKQIPNFLLAAPMIILSLYAVLTYCCDKLNHESIQTLGLLPGKHTQDDLVRYG